MRGGPRLRLVPLVDTRVGSDDMAHPLFGEPALDFPTADRRHHQYSRLVDLRAAEFLRGTDADVLIGTRPGSTPTWPASAPAAPSGSPRRRPATTRTRTCCGPNSPTPTGRWTPW
ncbi:hypothetical protein O1L55_30465 [Streptomyces albulus]|nr:hypothetical protein [Streptomyces noursei]